MLRFLRDCDREKALLVLAAFQSHYSPLTRRITTKAAKKKKKKKLSSRERNDTSQR